MKLENEFTVPVDVDTVYQALNDPERVTPCFPGATLDTLDGDDFTGTVKVKLGPISMTYKGKGTFVERDATNHKVVVDAQGRDSRGNGTASAKATLTMTDQGGGSTKVSVLTEMQVTGKPAQFGRGVMSDVGDKILGQFASCLAEEFPSSTPSSSSPTSAPEPALAETPGGGVAPVGTPSVDATPAPAAPNPVATAGRPEPMPMATTVAEAAAASSGPSTATPGASPTPTPLSTAAASGTPATAPTAARPRQRPEQAEAIDLLGSSREAVLKRLVPVGAAAGVLAALIALIVVLRNRS